MSGPTGPDPALSQSPASRMGGPIIYPRGARNPRRSCLKNIDNLILKKFIMFFNLKLPLQLAMCKLLLLTHLILCNSFLSSSLNIELSLNHGSLRQSLLTAMPGDFITIGSGLYRGPEFCNITITVSNISIFGNGVSTVLDCSDQFSRHIVIDASDTLISGILFRGGGYLTNLAVSDSNQGQTVFRGNNSSKLNQKVVVCSLLARTQR